MDIKTILIDSFDFFSSNIRQIASLCLPLLFVAIMLQYGILSIHEPIPDIRIIPVIALLVELIIYPIYTGALILLIHKRTNQEYPNNQELILSALKIWWSLFMVNVFTTFMTGFGLMLFIIPGVWVAVRLSFAEFLLIVSNLPPMEAVYQSYSETKQYFRVIFICIISVVVPIWIINFLLEKFIVLSGNFYMLRVISKTGTSFLELFVNIVLFRIFMLTVLKQSKSSVTAQ